MISYTDSLFVEQLLNVWANVPRIHKWLIVSHNVALTIAQPFRKAALNSFRFTCHKVVKNRSSREHTKKRVLFSMEAQFCEDREFEIILIDH